MRFQFLLAGLGLIGAVTARSQFEVSLLEQRVVGQKVLLKLELQHTFPQPVRSARAQVFLSRNDGVVVGRDVRWIIGSPQGLGPLPPSLRTNYHLAVPIEGLFEQIHFGFSRVVLEDGTSVDTGVRWSVATSSNPRSDPLRQK